MGKSRDKLELISILRTCLSVRNIHIDDAAIKFICELIIKCGFERPIPWMEGHAPNERKER